MNIMDVLLNVVVCFVYSLRGIGLTEEAGDDLAEIMAEMPSLNLLE